MQLHLKYLVAACGLAVAGHASALALTAGVTVVPRANIIYVSGASAQGPDLTAALTNATFGMCVNGTATVYTIAGNNNDRAVFCTFKGAAPAPAAFAGQNVLVIKRDAGGSAYGFYPFYTGAGGTGGQIPAVFQNAGEAGPNLQFLDYTTCTGPASGTGTCTALTTAGNAIKPDAGLADVEPKVFDAAFKTAALAAASLPQLGLQGFGVAVDLALRNALQTQQGLTSGSELPADQPNLARGVVAAILADSGGLSAYQGDWSQVITGSARNVTVCRRTNGSGTQQSSNLYFLGTQSLNGPLGGSLTPSPAQGARGTGYAVIENSSTGNAKICLDAADNSATEFAIGVLSLENLMPTSTATPNRWRFVKLNGVSPTAFWGTGNNVAPGAADTTQLRSMVEGNYEFAFESVGFADSTKAPIQSFMTALKAQFGNPALGPFTGIAVVPGTSFYTTDPTQVAKGTRFGNNAQNFQAQP